METLNTADYEIRTHKTWKGTILTSYRRKIGNSSFSAGSLKELNAMCLSYLNEKKISPKDMAQAIKEFGTSS